MSDCCRLGEIIQRALNRVQDILRKFIGRWQQIGGRHVSPEQCLLRTDGVIRAADNLVFVCPRDRSECHLAAWARGLRQELHDIKGLWTELAYWNLIVWITRVRKRISQLTEIASAEIALKHSCRRNKAGAVDGIRSRYRALIATKEECLVLHDRPAERPTVLIALQCVAACCKEIPRIHFSIAKEFERAAVEFVGARSHDGVHCAGRVDAARSRLRAGFDFELLKRVGKRERKVRRVVRIVVRYSIQEIPNAVEHSSSDRNVQAARHARSSNLARWNRRAGQLDQLDRIAA